MGIGQELSRLISSSAVTFVAGLILGGIVSYYVEKPLKAIDSTMTSLKRRIGQRRVNSAWRLYDNLLQHLKVVQTGWDDGIFSESQDMVVITVDQRYKLPDQIEPIRQAHYAEWIAQNLHDNEQVGIHALDPHRVSDGFGEKTHVLFIAGHIYHYFDFLSTNRVVYSGNGQEKRSLIQYIPIMRHQHYLEPIQEFANPLSVGLTLFCEDGRYLVLTRRTKLTSSGGSWSSNTVFNAVGENITTRDCDNRANDNRVSPWITAQRGLREEMGLFECDLKDDIALHTFAWDDRILDYKFFGHVITPLARSEVTRRWEQSSDRHESRSLQYIECATKKQRIQFIKMLISNQGDWSEEAILSTLRSLSIIYHSFNDELEMVLSKQAL